MAATGSPATTRFCLLRKVPQALHPRRDGNRRGQVALAKVLRQRLLNDRSQLLGRQAQGLGNIIGC